MRRSIVLLSAVLALLGGGAAFAQNAAPRNLILFIPDGLRALKVTRETAPAMAEVRDKGVNFKNPHSLFPTFTMANGSAMATGHYLGDTGTFSNTIYTAYPVAHANNTVTPFLEVDPVLLDVDEHFGGDYLNEETILKMARAQGFSTAAIGKLGPTFLFDHTDKTGADGLHSTIAKLVQPEEYDCKPSLTFGYYAYWTGVPDTGMHIHFFDDGHGVLVFPTNWGQTCIGVGGSSSGFHDFRKDIEGNYLSIIDRIPELSGHVRAGKREGKFLGTADMPNYFRKPYGPGWALTGDAGYHRDFITGLGINDAFLQAELLTEAVDDAFSERRSEEEAFATFEKERNRFVKPTYDMTVKMAAGENVEPMELMAFGVAIAAMIPA